MFEEFFLKIRIVCLREGKGRTDEKKKKKM